MAINKIYNKKILRKNHKNYQHDRRLQQLLRVLEDKDYWSEKRSLAYSPNAAPINEDSSYKGFVTNMKAAIIDGRKITDKMNKAMKNIVIRYLDNKDPERLKEKSKGTELLLEKIEKVGTSLSKAGYSSDYTSGALNFLNSVMKQAKIRGSITDKQKLALNKMFKRFNKRIERNG
tara:strand:+ start:1158 stop:1682 length:525 start_codon:yes stop_codon:yes gene_type:complete